ncbi:MAG: hypothetical protein PHN89_02725 [Candidatus Pacebacteria bacterium]|nr:hypothetical protein [Candidatus Paceibacterota bacterium]
MTTTLEGLKALIKTKLESLVDGGGKSIFGDIFDYPDGEFGNYPAAVILQKGADGIILDTARNERVFHFVINLFQEQSGIGKNKEESDELMTKASDAIIKAFDQDPGMGGEVEKISVVEATFDFRVQKGTFNFATFKVDCVVVVDNN